MDCGLFTTSSIQPLNCCAEILVFFEIGVASKGKNEWSSNPNMFITGSLLTRCAHSRDLREPSARAIYYKPIHYTFKYAAMRADRLDSPEQATREIAELGHGI